jgi:hypothetical protein
MGQDVHGAMGILIDLVAAAFQALKSLGEHRMRKKAAQKAPPCVTITAM